MNAPTPAVPNALMERISPRLAPTYLRSLDDWSVLKYLGSGNTADVWLLEHKTHGQQIVCKTPCTPEAALELSQEAKLAAQLSHENLIRPVTTSIDDELPTLQAGNATWWEFLAGGTLHQLVEATGPLSLAETVTVVLPMVQVTQYLHTRQVVHGDISPSNIMFDLTGRPVLIDLGASRATAHSYVRTGTVGFTAPELHLNQHQSSVLHASADIYALAAVAWYCLTATVPGSAAHRIPLTSLQPDLDSEIAQVLEGCLHDVPGLRPDLDRLVALIARWAKPEPISLHASVGEEYELLLPTLRPDTQESSRNVFGFRKSRKPHRSIRSGRPSRHRVASVRKSQRVVLLIGTLVLAAGVFGTYAYGPEPIQKVTQATPEATTFDEQDGFQAVVDQLAKARSAAWASADSSQVANYALTDSPVFRDDTEQLTVLADAGHRLEGLRMRAVVDDVVESGEATILSITWRLDKYSQVDASGGAIREVESQEESLKLEVMKTPEGWRMVSIQ